MDLTIEPCEYYGWPGYRVAGAGLELGLAPDIGGRLVSLRYLGQELLYVEAARAGEIPDLRPGAPVEEVRRALGFRLYGGDKTWVAPQSAWSDGLPPLDLHAGPYAAGIEDRGVFLISGQCRETGLRIARRFELFADERVVLTEEFRNPGPTPIRRGIWNVTQFRRPMVVFLPAARAAVRPYAQEGDSLALYERLVSAAGSWTQIDCNAAAHCKFGARLERGEVLARHPRTGQAGRAVAYMRSFAIEAGAEYAHDAMAEVYNSPDHEYLEIECHAPLRAVPAGGAVRFTQTWRFGEVSHTAGPDEIRSACLSSNDADVNA